MRLLDELKRLRTQILAAAAANGAHDVRIFGSVARGDDSAESDVDVLVALRPGRILLDLANAIGSYVARGREISMRIPRSEKRVMVKKLDAGTGGRALTVTTNSRRSWQVPLARSRAN